MIGQMTVLLRLKRLKEEQALRALQAKRREVTAAEEALAQARAAVAASAASLPAREDAIYAAILYRVVDPDDLEETRGAVEALRREHLRLVDAAERAAYVLHRLAEELAERVQAHLRAARTTEKYDLVRGDLVAVADAAAAVAEENEVDEMFGSRRQEVA
ncbi:YscO family type III secretion system apparatus protein [uncultured Methylobacterium sp.]|jgi:hypothetical protein|uniref:type III secretion system stalk subunit SctO n=1 Tax=uncultured Methylobacterium sp. TaxID=157278 RepID=UPI002628CCD0|nr:YscO family type III secretion system apparatus protein [uncultured Methylobacterium sp.]